MCGAPVAAAGVKPACIKQARGVPCTAIHNLAMLVGGRTVTKYGTTEKRVGPKRRDDSSVVDDRTSAIVIDGWHHRAVRTSRSVEPHVSTGTPRHSAHASTEKSCPPPSCTAHGCMSRLLRCR